MLLTSLSAFCSLSFALIDPFRIKDARAKKREKKLWRESSYAELERETRERLAGEEVKRQGKGKAEKGGSIIDREKADGGRRRESWSSERGGSGEKGGGFGSSLVDG